MPNNCYACKYKRLAREVLHDFGVLSTLLGHLDAEVCKTWTRIVEAHRREFGAIHEQQQHNPESVIRNCKMRLQSDGSILNVG